MKSVAPNFLAQASLPGFVSTAIMRDALIKLEVWITPRPMAPQPKTQTVELAIDDLAVKLTKMCATTH